MHFIVLLEIIFFMYASICILYVGPSANDNLVKMKLVDINTGGYNINETIF